MLHCILHSHAATLACRHASMEAAVTRKHRASGAAACIALAPNPARPACKNSGCNARHVLQAWHRLHLVILARLCFECT